MRRKNNHTSLTVARPPGRFVSRRVSFHFDIESCRGGVGGEKKTRAETFLGDVRHPSEWRARDTCARQIAKEKKKNERSVRKMLGVSTVCTEILLIAARRRTRYTATASRGAGPFVDDIVYDGQELEDCLSRSRMCFLDHRCPVFVRVLFLGLGSCCVLRRPQMMC